MFGAGKIQYHLFNATTALRMYCQPPRVCVLLNSPNVPPPADKRRSHVTKQLNSSQIKDHILTGATGGFRDGILK